MSVSPPGRVEAAEGSAAAVTAPAKPAIAYLVNQYPKISHQFIRREIEALENCGFAVERYSLRRCRDRLVDAVDWAEREKTRIVLESGVVRMALHMAATALSRPGRFARALKLAVQTGWGSDRGVLVHMAYLAEACVLLRWLARRPVRHMHAHFATNPAAVAMLCHLLGGPSYSFTAHGPDDFDRARMLSLNEKVARARFIITVSSWGRSQLYRWCDRLHWGKIQVLHPGIDDGFLQTAPAPLPFAPRLVCVGRLDEEKGQLLLLEAVRELADGGVDCQLTLIGEGPLRAQIQDSIERLHLQSQVVLAGAVATGELCAQIQGSRALVVASLAENLPSVIMEAFALGRPAIATYVGGIPELVQPGVNGWLVPAGSVEGLKKAMREALTASPQRLEEMGQEGRRRVMERFRSSDAAGELARLFRQREAD